MVFKTEPLRIKSKWMVRMVEKEDKRQDQHQDHLHKGLYNIAEIFSCPYLVESHQNSRREEISSYGLRNSEDSNKARTDLGF